MAKVSTNADDILYAKGEVITADAVQKIKVPGLITGKERGNTILTFDVRSGGRGEKELLAMHATAIKKTMEAWAPLLALKKLEPVNPDDPQGNGLGEDDDTEDREQDTAADEQDATVDQADDTDSVGEHTAPNGTSYGA